MIVFKYIKIRSYEMGLYFRDGEFKGLLSEGRHWLFDPLGQAQVRRVDLNDPVYEQPPWRSMAYSDIDRVFEPRRSFWAREAGQGRVPSWNPRIFAGAPEIGERFPGPGKEPEEERGGVEQVRALRRGGAAPGAAEGVLRRGHGAVDVGRPGHRLRPDCLRRWPQRLLAKQRRAAGR